jgi:hypothetical protein
MTPTVVTCSGGSNGGRKSEWINGLMDGGSAFFLLL